MGSFRSLIKFQGICVYADSEDDKADIRVRGDSPLTGNK